MNLDLMLLYTAYKIRYTRSGAVSSSYQKRDAFTDIVNTDDHSSNPCSPILTHGGGVKVHSQNVDLKLESLTRCLQI